MKNLFQYKTLANTGTGEFKDRGSKFIALAKPIESIEDTHKILDEYKKIHGKANHHCYAWRLGLDGNIFRSNDDGEPSGTAGKPILGQIDSAQLTNVIVIVIRYFGGSLLGTSGLINAYRTASSLAINNSIVIEKEISEYYLFTCSYEIMPHLMDTMKKQDLRLINQNFGLLCELTIQFPKNKWQNKIPYFIALALSIREDQVNPIDLFPDLKWELVGSW